MSSDKVTLRDIYDAVNRLEDKFSKRMDAVEEDVDGLKSFQNKFLGIAIVFASLVSTATTYVWNKIVGQA